MRLQVNSDISDKRYKVRMFKLLGMYQYVSTAVLFCGTVFPPRLMASTSVKSPVYTVQYDPLCVKTLCRL